jgi:YtxH-like protein
MVFERASFDDDVGGRIENQLRSIERNTVMNDVKPGGGTSVMVAALVGAAVGAGMALLFAPRSGSETRRWLAHTTREIKARTTSAFGRVGRDGERATTVDAATMRT